MLEKPFLVFSMPLDNTPELNRGRLVLYDYEQGHIGHWVATSGLGSWQKIGGWSKQGGGCIPAPYQCNPNFANYWMQVAPIDLSHVKGVEGDAYPITPFQIKTKEGVTRSDLLVHRDANVPGSRGCIVMSREEFADFCKVINQYLSGVEQIKLFVQYDY